MTRDELALVLSQHRLWLDAKGGTRADLTRAVLTRADLRGAVGIRAPIVPSIDAAILAAIDRGGQLDMGEWHSCETTHCRAGWAVHLAGEAGYMLEDRIGPAAAGALIYAATAHSGFLRVE